MTSASERIELPGGAYFRRQKPDGPWFSLFKADGISVPASWYEHEARAFAAAMSGASDLPRYRHKKRGTTYTVLGEAGMQNSGAAIVGEGTSLVFYRSDDTDTLWCRPRAEFHDGRFERIDPAAPTRSAGVAGGVDLNEACKPWEFATGPVPEWGSPLHGVFVAGMLYTEKLLCDLLDVKGYEPGDGSEDFDSDATKSLSNILTEAGMYDPEDGRFATLAAAPEPPAPGGEQVRLAEIEDLVAAHELATGAFLAEPVSREQSGRLTNTRNALLTAIRTALVRPAADHPDGVASKRLADEPRPVLPEGYSAPLKPSWEYARVVIKADHTDGTAGVREEERVARAIFGVIWPEAEDRFHPDFMHDEAIWTSAAKAAICALKRSPPDQTAATLRDGVDRLREVGQISFGSFREAAEKAYALLCVSDQPGRAEITNACAILKRALKRSPPDQTAEGKAVAGEDGWRPIETAPRDGAHVLLGTHWRALTVRFDRDVGYFSDDAEERGWVSLDGCDLHPTHWQPLPEPPTNPHDAGRSAGREKA